MQGARSGELAGPDVWDTCREPKIAWDDEQARAALVSALVNDALGRLDALPAQPEGRGADATGLLALA